MKHSELWSTKAEFFPNDSCVHLNTHTQAFKDIQLPDWVGTFVSCLGTLICVPFWTCFPWPVLVHFLWLSWLSLTSHFLWCPCWPLFQRFPSPSDPAISSLLYFKSLHLLPSTTPTIGSSMGTVPLVSPHCDLWKEWHIFYLPGHLQHNAWHRLATEYMVVGWLHSSCLVGTTPWFAETISLLKTQPDPRT